MKKTTKVFTITSKFPDDTQCLDSCHNYAVGVEIQSVIKVLITDLQNYHIITSEKARELFNFNTNYPVNDEDEDEIISFLEQIFQFETECKTKCNDEDEEEEDEEEEVEDEDDDEYDEKVDDLIHQLIQEKEDRKRDKTFIESNFNVKNNAKSITKPILNKIKDWFRD